MLGLFFAIRPVKIFPCKLESCSDRYSFLSALHQHFIGELYSFLADFFGWFLYDGGKSPFGQA
jgi:hypothetical protein